jgi:hypothetical protein
MWFRVQLWTDVGAGCRFGCRLGLGVGLWWVGGSWRGHASAEVGEPVAEAVGAGLDLVVGVRFGYRVVIEVSGDPGAGAALFAAVAGWE